MRVIQTELWPQEAHPVYGEGIYVGVEGEEHVAGVHEGEPVILRESYEVEINATMHLVELKGRMVWFGQLTSDYRQLDPETGEVAATVSTARPEHP